MPGPHGGARVESHLVEVVGGEFGLVPAHAEVGAHSVGVVKRIGRNDVLRDLCLQLSSEPQETSRRRRGSRRSGRHVHLCLGHPVELHQAFHSRSLRVCPQTVSTGSADSPVDSNGRRIVVIINAANAIVEVDIGRVGSEIYGELAGEDGLVSIGVHADFLLVEDRGDGAGVVHVHQSLIKVMVTFNL